ncbi:MULTISPECIES: AAA family ATPase [unclassified Pseudomonas]|uniref:AAA family ATPase n=1 Tax=unclassified Pseudomonas TaxID=196821 RepID=UPI0019145143|nr:MULTISPECIES: ATP-binding protein [unclassified Pseudomonas]MBK5554206.1 ATP-binding protein [Pseudomonas sp. TH03]MEB0224385.1 ATP-binding protein [Pseudomonas sp. 5S1]MEB0293181.1 ATP-binding protein [Pseudomonas sp. 10S4]WPX17883.1 ATP-binding protein [Pseudomonas sp. 10S4]
MTATTLHLMCGKIASGKSTLAKALADQHAAILLSEDRWLSQLYPQEIHSVTDYVRYALRVREVLGPLVVDMLTAGVCVVLDFPANTVANREWLRTLAERAQAQHCLHYLDVDDDTCRARLRVRNATGDHDFAATDAEFDLITSYFKVPEAQEGLAIVVHS